MLSPAMGAEQAASQASSSPLYPRLSPAQFLPQLLRAFIPHPIPCWALDPLPSPLLAGILESGPSLSLSDPASARRALSSTPSCSVPRHPALSLPALQSLTYRGGVGGGG